MVVAVHQDGGRFCLSSSDGCGAVGRVRRDPNTTATQPAGRREGGEEGGWLERTERINEKEIASKTERKM